MMGLLAMLAAPLVAGAEPAQPNNPETTGFQDVTQATHAAGAGVGKKLAMPSTASGVPLTVHPVK
jgi:hypothetical protein